MHEVWFAFHHADIQYKALIRYGRERLCGREESVVVVCEIRRDSQMGQLVPTTDVSFSTLASRAENDFRQSAAWTQVVYGCGP